MQRLNQNNLPISLDKLQQLSQRSGLRNKFVAAIIRNNSILTWAVNERNDHAEKAVLKKLEKVQSEDILLVYRSLKDHSYPCMNCLQFIRQKGIKRCAYWDKLQYGKNKFKLEEVKKMSTQYQTQGTKKIAISCNKCPRVFQTFTQVANHARIQHNGKDQLYHRQKFIQSGWQIGKKLKQNKAINQDQFEYIVPDRK